MVIQFIIKKYHLLINRKRKEKYFQLVYIMQLIVINSCKNNIMAQEKIQELSSKWTLWVSFSCQYKKDIDYGNNIVKIMSFETWPDLLYFWENTKFKNPSNYFIDPQTGKFNNFQIGQEIRKVDSINFFKQDIQPKWQYGDNKKGGYFNFSIFKGQKQEMAQKIYQATVFLAIGNVQKICPKLIGVRIVDTLIKQNKKNQCRIQLWVNFRHEQSQQNLKMLQQQKQNIVKYYMRSVNYQIGQMRFFNISK